MLSKTYLKILLYSAVTVIALGVLLLKYSLVVNIDESSPYTLFLVIKGEMPQKVDDYIVFDAPPSSRYQLKFVKKVGGMPGDEVNVIGNSFFVRGAFLGIAKETDSQGNPVKRSEGGVIPNNSYFIYSEKENSYDSKYAEIGLITSDKVVGVAIAIL